MARRVAIKELRRRAAISRGVRRYWRQVKAIAKVAEVPVLQARTLRRQAKRKLGPDALMRELVDYSRKRVERRRTKERARWKVIFRLPEDADDELFFFS